eukprot:1156011-Pelagomonas_calceolata.AAC.8
MDRPMCWQGCEVKQWEQQRLALTFSALGAGLRILHGLAGGAFLGASGDAGGPGIEPSWR